MATPLNLTKLSLEDAAKALQTSSAAIRAHIARGAPISDDGVINLVHYAAWLNTQLHRAVSGGG